ncbi:MAG: hypothetical protein AAF264_01460 [Pseudomonadota bacterium]
MAGPHDYTYAKIQAYDGNFEVYANCGALTKVLDDLVFRITGDGARLREEDVVWGETLSPERMPAQNADFLFDTYRIDQGQGDSPAQAIARMAEVLPSYCQVLTACAEGRYIFMPREHAAPISFRTMEMLVHYVVSHTAGRAGIADPT